MTAGSRRAQWSLATVMTTTPPNPADRFLSVAYYFGLAPLAKFWRSSSSNPFLRHHHDEGLSSRLVAPEELFHPSTHESFTI